MLRRLPRSSHVGVTALLFSLLLAVEGQASPPVIAVFDVRDKSGRFGPEELEQLSTYLGAQLASSRAFRIIPRAQIKEALSGQKAESYKACYDESCQIEIGKELAAEKSVLTEIIGVGTQCAVTSTLFDLMTSASELAASEKTQCNQDALVSALEKVAARLSGTEPAEKPSPKPSPVLYAPPPTPSSWSTGKILVVSGWSTFGLGYLGTVFATIASEPYEGQVAAAFIPLYGPVRVESINKTNNFDSGGLPYVGLAFQAAGLVAAVVGHLLPDSPLGEREAGTARYSFGVGPRGVFVGGTF